MNISLGSYTLESKGLRTAPKTFTGMHEKSKGRKTQNYNYEKNICRNCSFCEQEGDRSVRVEKHILQTFNRTSPHYASSSAGVRACVLLLPGVARAWSYSRMAAAANNDKA